MSNEFSVLIVEDDDDARRNMEDILSLDGYKIQSASHCLAAIHAIETERFDAVIVDWRLPDENADQLLPIIVRERPHTPVVVVTGSRDFDTAVTALRNGAYDFLLKPINPDMLRSVLSRIEERKRHLATIESSREKLLMNERLAAIGQMVAGLAHESRNAFQRSHACLEELQLDLGDNPAALKLIKKVQKALHDLHMLLEEVRSYSAPVILERRACSLQTIIQETWQQILDAKKMEHPPVFTVSKTEDFPTTCFLDGDRFRMVIRNLLENALFACSGSGAVDVDLALVKSEKPEQSVIQLTVTDSGSGIPPADLEKLFVPFFTTKTKGTGLGLSVSQRYVDAHGGRIYATHSKTGGARFVVEIPYRKR